MRSMTTLFAAALLIAYLMIGCEQPGDSSKITPSDKAAEGTGKAAASIGASGKPKLEFYVMSKCPYGVQVENAIGPVLKKLGDAMAFELNFIVTETSPGVFDSLHGQPEVEGNLVQLCSAKYYPDKYMDMIFCMNKNARDIPGNWEQCATETGLDTAKISICKDGDEGKKLLSESAKRAQARQAGGSPTIYLNGEQYSSGRTELDFLRAICNGMSGSKPETCMNIPEPPEVLLTVLNDSRCKDCAAMAPNIVSQLKGLFPGLKVKNLDYGTEEGKKLFADTQVKLLPAVLFDSSIDKDEKGKNHLARWLKPAGAYQNLMVGAKFDPTAEICDNGKDDTGNGKVDCEDETCKQDMLCRKEMKNRLDVFVMSQCPFGVKALNAMEEVLSNFKGGIDFHVNYIANENGDGFSSLHGQGEVDENIRQLCAITHYTKDNKYMDYILCRNKNILGADWESCTGGNGIQTGVIKKCFEGDEGKRLLRENIKIGNGIGISGSPTWLTNNKHTFSGVDAETVKSNVCKYNPGLKGCENTLSKTNNSSTGGAQCGQ